MGAAAGTVAATDVILTGFGWSGLLSVPKIPTSGFTGTDQFNVSALPRGLRGGRTCHYYDETAGGEVGMIYLKIADAGDSAIAAGSILRPSGATDNSGEILYYVSNDTDDDMLGSGRGPGAIALGATTDGYWAWAWYAGHCPQDGKAFCSALAAASIATYLDAGNSAAGPFAFGDAASGDAGALIEVIAGCNIAGYILSASGATAT